MPWEGKIAPRAKFLPKENNNSSDNMYFLINYNH